MAAWSRRLGIFAVPVAVLTTLSHRFGDLDTGAGLVLLGIVFALAFFALVAGCAAFASIWRRGGTGTGQAMVGVVCAVLVLAWPAWRGASLIYLPQINDVTTDWFAPPQFEAVARYRPPGARSLDYPGQDYAIAQREAYPEIVPLFLSYPANDVFQAALDLSDTRGWRIVSAIAPGLEGRGRIEAIAGTLVFGFKDDVVITVVREGPVETRVDMRSASRYGRHDLGANAARIYDFLTALTRRLEEPVVEERLPLG